MQLTRRQALLPLRSRIAALLVAAFSLAAPAPARADKDNHEDPPAVTDKDIPAPPITKEQSSRPEDTSGKRIALEMSTYEDSDHVTVFTPSINATVDNVTQGASISGHYLVDVVSAASADIVTTASSRWKEVRQAAGLEGTYKPHETGVTLAGSMSSEPDYLALSVGAQLMHEFNEKNSTLLFGYGYSHNTVGYHFTPFSVFSRLVQSNTFSLGLTQVIDRSTVGSLAVDADFESGDQSKPYRYIPMFSPVNAALVTNGASIADVARLRLPERPAEQLPMARARYSLTGRVAHRFDGSTLRLEERGYADSWLMFASSSDLRWIVDLGRRFELWPHLRFHAQKAVNFWQRAYIDPSTVGFQIPEFRTGNRELGPLVSETGGVGIKVFLGKAGNPKSLSIALHADAVHTNYLNDIYITSRNSILSALILDGEL